jgi:organic radical activating enzyme
MLQIPSLEFHLMHACNLSCQQCSHYSNLRLGGGVISTKDAESNYAVWSHRIQPKLFALLGGEPTLNPNLVDHVLLARKHWSKSKFMLVSNGFFLSKHPDLPKVLVETNCCLEISQHGKDEKYLEEFIKGTEILKEWSSKYPSLKIRTRQSHQGWMRQYNVSDDGKPIPYNSKAEEAYSVCMQKTCTQVYQQKLWKCPAIAYFQLLDKKMSLDKEWDLFRQYSALEGDCSEEALGDFFNTKAIPQCSLCPFNRESFQHPDPTISNQKLF